MEKVDWFNLSKAERIDILNEKLDKLGTALKVHEKKQLEKEIYEIFNWEQKYDE